MRIAGLAPAVPTTWLYWDGAGQIHWKIRSATPIIGYDVEGYEVLGQPDTRD